MSGGGQERVSLAVEVKQSSQKWSVQRSAVRSIACLDPFVLRVCFRKVSKLLGDIEPDFSLPAPPHEGVQIPSAIMWLIGNQCVFARHAATGKMLVEILILPMNVRRLRLGDDDCAFLSGTVVYGSGRMRLLGVGSWRGDRRRRYDTGENLVKAHRSNENKMSDRCRASVWLVS
jgi:hypothetical protein